MDSKRPAKLTYIGLHFYSLGGYQSTSLHDLEIFSESPTCNGQVITYIRVHKTSLNTWELLRLEANFHKKPTAY
jgi:hypothetical protein